MKNIGTNKQAFISGEVALVGAGPGDADLLTIQAFRFIKQADIVIYDRLVSDEIMALLPSTCEKIYVGNKQNTVCRKMVSTSYWLIMPN